MITLLNTSILTEYGMYKYNNISLQSVRNLMCDGFISAIGHQSVCDLLTTLTGYEVPYNRINYSQQVDSYAIVFKLNSRIEEGRTLTIEEMEEIGYSFGLIYRYN